MFNIPIYNEYNGEKKIALLDNSAISFMLQLENKGYKPETLLQEDDVIFLPGWVVEELQDSDFRVHYIEKLVQKGIPIFVIKESFYSDLMDGKELFLYYIVKASVSKLAAFIKYMRLNVEKKNPLDMVAYEEWMKRQILI